MVLAAADDLLPGGTRDSRAVRLEHGEGANEGWIVASTINKLFASKDGGKTFTPIGDASVPDGLRLRCRETLLKLTQGDGHLKAGALLYAATYVKNVMPPPSAYPTPSFAGDFAIQVFARTVGTGVLIAEDGSMVMFWSDETYKCCSQKLLKIRSSNGRDCQIPLTSLRQRSMPTVPE